MSGIAAAAPAGRPVRHYVIDARGGRPVLAPRTYVYRFGGTELVSARALDGQQVARLGAPRPGEVVHGEPPLYVPARMLSFDEGGTRIVLHVLGEVEAGRSPRELLVAATLASGGVAAIEDAGGMRSRRGRRSLAVLLAGASLAGVLVGVGGALLLGPRAPSGAGTAPGSELVRGTVSDPAPPQPLAPTPTEQVSARPPGAPLSVPLQVLSWDDWKRLAPASPAGEERYCNRHGDLVIVAPGGGQTVVACGGAERSAVCAAGQCVAVTAATAKKLPARLCGRGGTLLELGTGSKRTPPRYHEVRGSCPAAYYQDALAELLPALEQAPGGVAIDEAAVIGAWVRYLRWHPGAPHTIVGQLARAAGDPAPITCDQAAAELDRLAARLTERLGELAGGSAGTLVPGGRHRLCERGPAVKLTTYRFALVPGVAERCECAAAR